MQFLLRELPSRPRLAFQRTVERTGDQETKSRDEEQPASHFADHGMESLRFLPYAAEEETQAQAQQEVREDGAQNRGLDHGDEIPFFGRVVIVPFVGTFVFGDEDEEQDDFDNASQGCLDEDPGDLGHFACEFLAREAQQVRRRDHADVGGGEDPLFECFGVSAGEVMQDNGDGDERPEDVDCLADAGGGAKQNAEEG